MMIVKWKSGIGHSRNAATTKLDEMFDEHVSHLNDDSSMDSYKQAFSDLVKAGIVSTNDYQKGKLVRKLLEEFLITDFVLNHCARYTIIVRLGVNFYLFGFSIMKFGNEAQQRWLQTVFDAGELGCFAFTEKRARAVTGAIVESTCRYTEKGLILNGEKMWIGQGCTAKWAVVLARLILLDGEDKGPHWFIVNLEEKEKTNQLVRTLMPAVGNTAQMYGMDWAYLTFNDCLLSAGSMLSKQSDITEFGEYINISENDQSSKDYLKQFVFERLGMSSGLMNDINMIMNELEDTLRNKLMCYGKGLKDDISFTKLPFFRDQITKNRHVSHVIQRYLHQVADQIVNNESITSDIEMNVNIGKIIATDYFLHAVVELKMSVGAYCLAHDNAFHKRQEFGYVVKCIGGDSNLLILRLMKTFIYELKPRIFKKICSLIVRKMQPFHFRRMFRKKEYECDRKFIGFVLSMRNLNRKQRIAKFYDEYEEIKNMVQLKGVLHIYQTVKMLNKPEDDEPLQTFERYLIPKY